MIDFEINIETLYHFLLLLLLSKSINKWTKKERKFINNIRNWYNPHTHTIELYQKHYFCYVFIFHSFFSWRDLNAKNVSFFFFFFFGCPVNKDQKKSKREEKSVKYFSLSLSFTLLFSIPESRIKKQNKH